MIEMGKQYQTRDGRPVRILCVDGNGLFSVIGIINKEEYPTTWPKTGGFFLNGVGESQLDLIPVPAKHHVDLWIPIRKDGDPWFAYKRQQDLTGTNPTYLGQIHITGEITEGAVVEVQLP